MEKQIVMDEIDKLLEEHKNKTARTVKTKDLLPKKIFFTERAYEKASMVGPTIERLTGTPLEWSAFLLAEKGDKNFLVRDILIHEGQDISRGNVEMTGEEIGKTIPELKRRNEQNGTNHYVIGWIHGHGRFALIPSSTDRRNFVKVLNSVKLNTEQKTKLPLKLIETELISEVSGGKIIYSGKAIEDAAIEITMPAPESLEALVAKSGLNLVGKKSREKATELARLIVESSEMQFFQSNIFGFAYYVIMNNVHDKPYAGIGYSAEKSITKTSSSFDLVEGLDVGKVKIENDLIYTEAELEKEIKEKIDYQWDSIKKVKSWLSNVSLNVTDTYWKPDDEQSERPSFFKGYGGYGAPKRSEPASYTPIYIPSYGITELESMASELESSGSIDEAEKVKSLISLLKRIDKGYSRQGIRSATQSFLEEIGEKETMKTDLDDLLEKNDT